MRRSAWALSLAMGLLSAGCAARTPLPHPPPAIMPSVEQLEAALATRHDAVRSLRALARLRYRDPNETTTSKEALVVARPDSVRVEVLSVLGSVFVLTANKGAMTAYVRNDKTVYRGQASPQNLGRYARLGLPVSTLVDIVLGTPSAVPGGGEVSYDAEAGAVRLSRTYGQGSVVVWFSEATLPVATEERSATGQSYWRATFGQYEDHGGVPIATQIRLELPMWSQSIEIALDDVDVNPTLDHSIFALQTPPGSKVVDLDRVAD